MQFLTGNIEPSLSEKDVNFTCVVKKNCLFSTRALLEESPPGPVLRPWIAIKIWLNFVSKCSIDNDIALVQIMAWCRSATSHYLIEWWPSSLTHISVAGNKRIAIYDVSDCLWTDWEPMSRVSVQMGSVMSSYHHKHNKKYQIYRVFSKHNTYMCRYIARMYNRSRLLDARPSAIDMLTKRWIYRLNAVSNRVKHVVQVITIFFRDKSDPAPRVDSP